MSATEQEALDAGDAAARDDEGVHVGEWPQDRRGPWRSGFDASESTLTAASEARLNPIWRRHSLGRHLALADAVLLVSSDTATT